jgi:hypothetical protein
MLATILKSPKATQTTIAIAETFAKIRELSRTIAELSKITEQFKQKSLMQKSGEIISEILGDDLQVSDTETSHYSNASEMSKLNAIFAKIIKYAIEPTTRIY